MRLPCILVLVFLATKSSGSDVDGGAKKYGWPMDACSNELYGVLKLMKFESPSGNLSYYRLDDVIEIQENSVEKLMFMVEGAVGKVSVENLEPSCPMLGFIDVEPSEAVSVSLLIINYIAKKCENQSEGFAKFTFYPSNDPKPVYSVVLKLRVTPQGTHPHAVDHKKTICPDQPVSNRKAVGGYHTVRIVRNMIEHATHANFDYDSGSILKAKLMVTWLLDAGHSFVAFLKDGTPNTRVSNQSYTFETTGHPFFFSYDFEVIGSGSISVGIYAKTSTVLGGGKMECSTFPGLADFVKTLNIGDLTSGPTEIVRTIGYQAFADGQSVKNVFTPEADSTTFAKRVCNRTVSKTDELAFVVKGVGQRIKITARSEPTGAVLVTYANRMDNRLTSIPFEGIRRHMDEEELEVIVENEETGEKQLYFLRVGCADPRPLRSIIDLRYP